MSAQGSTTLSVIIASSNAAGVIARCLAALMAQTIAGQIEIIVADCSSDGTACAVRERFPAVRLLCVPPPGTVPRLRGQAIAEAKGDIIAILDPYCRVEPDWAEKMVEAHRKHPDIPVIGGAVVLEEAAALPRLDQAVRWATFVSEYGAFIPPFAAGPASELTGNNLSYKRGALPAADELRTKGFWKTFYNAGLRRSGLTLRADPGIVASLHKPIALREFIISRYHHGRCFGGMRVAAGPTARRERLWRALTIPAVPFLTLTRQARALWPRRALRPRFLAALPLLLLFNLFWAWGEFNGYVRGPGNSGDHLRY